MFEIRLVNFDYLPGQHLWYYCSNLRFSAQHIRLSAGFFDCLGQWGYHLFCTKFQVIPPSCEDQLLLVDLVSAMKVMPTDTVIRTVKHVIKEPPPTSHSKPKVSVQLLEI